MKKPIGALPALTFMAICMVSIFIVFISHAGVAHNTHQQISVRVQSKQHHLSIVIKAPRVSEVQFYIFDVYGELVKHCQIKGSRTLIVEELSKGTYMYDAFSNDARIKSGKVELK